MKEDRVRLPRILLAAPKSGSGKTMITCGILQVLKRQGCRVAACKCGPDYIDPMFHRQVLGIPSGNLDTYFTDEVLTRQLLKKRAENMEITVLEGVMGYYDGLCGQSEIASTYEVARVTKTPVILIVDGKGASVSLAAMIKGIVEYKPDSGVAGIIINRISAGYYQRIKEVIENACGLPVLGYLPELKELKVPSRHLGLMAPEEMKEFAAHLDRLADEMEKTVDIRRIKLLAEAAEPLEIPALEPCGRLERPVRIAVARDRAFSFYYAENLELLEEMGAELVEFSPLHDRELPEGAAGMILGGGYLELYAEMLADNESMRKAVKSACDGGMPCIAECGGFLYLQQELETEEGRRFPMTGVLPGRGFPAGKLCRFGYMQAESKRGGLAGGREMVFKGHEFHYWDSTENGKDFRIGKPVIKRDLEPGGDMGMGDNAGCGEERAAYRVEYRESGMVHTPTLAAGFPHFYYYSNPDFVRQFLLSCQAYQLGRQAMAHWDSIAKPIDSLGLLEEAVVKMVCAAGDAGHCDIEKKALVVFCADHGVAAEGVTQTGQEVTRIVSENIAAGRSTVNIMADVAGADVYTVDVGINGSVYPNHQIEQGKLIDRKIAKGTGNLAREAAMTMEQCRRAMDAGREMVRELKERGYRLLAAGEMGIGNTTPASALAAVFLGKEPEAVTGKGAGLSPAGVAKKRQVIKRALARIEEKKINSPIEVLAEIGGLEIAALTGMFLAGLEFHIPIVMDGMISSAAALTAVKIDSRVSKILIASHVSEEPAAAMALEALGLKALVHGNLCLGEGTGAMTVLPMLDMAAKVYNRMGSFADYDIKPYERFGAD